MPEATLDFVVKRTKGSFISQSTTELSCDLPLKESLLEPGSLRNRALHWEGRGVVPADVHLVAQVQRVVRGRAVLEVADIEGGEGVVDEAVHGPVLAVHVQVHQAGDEVGREGDHEGLGGTAG